MLAWLKQCFRSKPSVRMEAKHEGSVPDYTKEAITEVVEIQDPLEYALRKVLETGNIVIGNRRDDGKWEVTEVPRKE